MTSQTNTAATIAALFAEYEAALIANDAAKLIGFFWDSPDALRFGAAESLYGADEINEFRRNRPAIDLARTVFNEKIVTFGDDTAITTLEFKRTVRGMETHGRQSQVWRKFGEEWKIVSAHVSLVPRSYMDEAAALIGLPIPVQFRDGVALNLKRVAEIAKPMLDFPIADSVESAPVFVP